MSFDLVLFGGTGDLAWRKLMPALFQAFRHGSLPEGGTCGRSRAVKRLVVPGDPAHRSPFQAGRDYLDPDSLPPSA